MDIQDLKRIKLEPNEVLWCQLDFGSLPNSVINKRIKDASTHLQSMFPNNKVLVSGKNITLTAISPQTAEQIEQAMKTTTLLESLDK